MDVTDPYKVLQVLPTAEQEVLNAAFRALALKYHPDHDPSTSATRRMIELNQAYAMVRDAKARSQMDRDRLRASYDFKAAPPTNGAAPPPRPRAANNVGTVLDQGRYAGWSLRDLVTHDPDYLRWLSRHTSGVRYRNEISRILGAKGVAA